MLFPPRHELLGADAALSPSDLRTIDARLKRLDDRSPHAAWTAAMLALIARQPGTRAADLATQLGRERLPFKADARNVKALGLTTSLEVGYRLSPRGEAYLRARPTG